jgi:hypothetical protein
MRFAGALLQGRCNEGIACESMMTGEVLVMRITNNMLINNMIKYIGNNLTRMDKYQSQLATGKKYGYRPMTRW